jgi:hypothetical protein
MATNNVFVFGQTKGTPDARMQLLASERGWQVDVRALSEDRDTRSGERILIYMKDARSAGDEGDMARVA